MGTQRPQAQAFKAPDSENQPSGFVSSDSHVTGSVRQFGSSLLCAPGGQPEELPNRPFSTRSVLFHLFLQVIIRHRQLLCSPGARSRAPDWATAYDANLAILRALRRERAATLAIVEFELVWAPHLLSRWTTRTASGTAR